MSIKVIQSHVYTKDKAFFVSTIYRESSAAVNSPPWYYEIYGWELNDDNSKGEWIIEESAGNLPEALKTHHGHCVKLIEENGIKEKP